MEFNYFLVMSPIRTTQNQRTLIVISCILLNFIGQTTGLNCWVWVKKNVCSATQAVNVLNMIYTPFLWVSLLLRTGHRYLGDFKRCGCLILASVSHRWVQLPRDRSQLSANFTLFYLLATVASYMSTTTLFMLGKTEDRSRNHPKFCGPDHGLTKPMASASLFPSSLVHCAPEARFELAVRIRCRLYQAACLRDCRNCPHCIIYATAK